MNSQDLLRTLIGFPTVSADSNLALIQHVQGLLEGAGIACRLVLDESGCKANLFASVGPGDVPGVLLSGHTDVVPVAGQAWTLPPFEGTLKEGRIHGRGACDMKGFVACAVVALLDAARGEPLKRPLQLALSHDEEIGCVGVRRLLDVLEMAPVRPFLCIVGEPTNMQVALGHKGKAALRAHCHGQEGHSSLAPRHVNAIHLASDLVGALRASQRRLAEEGAHDAAYDIPYTTLHVGRIDGGKALNIVPNLCTLDFEIRHLPADDPASLVAALQETADSLVREAQQTSAKAAIEIETVNAIPDWIPIPASRPCASCRPWSSRGRRSSRWPSAPRAASSPIGWTPRWWSAGPAASNRRTSPMNTSRSASWKPAMPCSDGCEWPWAKATRSLG